MDSINPLSEALAAPLEKLHRAGGLQLVFVFVGTLLMLAGALIEMERVNSLFISLSGGVVLGLSMIYFYYSQIQPVRRVREQIKRDAKLIDTAQDAAVELVKTADLLQDLTFKHANRVAGFLQEYGPTIRNLPLIGGAIADTIDRSENLALEIAQASMKTKGVVDNIAQALKESNSETLRTYIDDLRELQGQIPKLD